MARTRRTLPSAAALGPKERHRRAQRSQYDRQAPVPQGFVAKPPIPKSRHHTYFEFVENKEKKKKLEFQVTTKRSPPPGFEFVPIGNPQLTSACKELSREKDAMIFIVSNSKDVDTTQLAFQVHRVGHHIRQAIVDEAKTTITNLPHHVVSMANGDPEPIPESQGVYHAQADAAIRDLFPRIPNTDRRMIIAHAFTRGAPNKTEKPVGLSDDITLARRVQLAVLAHIRHNHTRYDELLKETTWQNARKVVEALCLDVLVKWRGDEETGRDQLDEILREVVVISDSEEDFDDEDSSDDTSVEDTGHAVHAPRRFSSYADATPRESPSGTIRSHMPSSPAPMEAPRLCNNEANHSITAAKRAQRGFKRYRAWEYALRRNHLDQPPFPQSPLGMSIGERPPQPPESRAAHYFDPRTHQRTTGSTMVLTGHANHDQLSYEPVPWALSGYEDRYRGMQRSDEVQESVAAGQLPSTRVRRRASPIGRPLQDMLVRSIEEPASPVVKPYFVRALPPASPGQGDPSFQGCGTYHRAGPVSHHGRTSPTDDRAYFIRGDMHGRSVQRDPVPSYSSEARSAQIPHPRDRDLHHPLDHHGIPSSYRVLYPVVHPHDPAPFPGRPSSRRIIVNAPRPGIRSNPVLMEDRGGFYERINVHAEHPTRSGEVLETFPVAQKATRAVETHTAPYSGRLAPEDRSIAGGSAVPASAPYQITAPLAGHPTTHQSLHQPSLGGALQENVRQEYRESARRPVPITNDTAPPPEGYWVINRNHDHPAEPPQRHYDWARRQPYIEQGQPVYQPPEIRHHHPSRPPSGVITIN